MRVLIVKTSSMGDVVHALPMVSDIARAFPHVRIDWVVEEAFAEIPRLHPAVVRVIPVALRRWRRSPCSRASWREARAARQVLRELRYHEIIDCQGLLKSALIAASARGPVAGPGPASAREPLASLLYRRRISLDVHQHAVDRSRRLGAAALGYALDGPEDFGLRARALQWEGPREPGAGDAPGDAPADIPAPPVRAEVLLFTHASRATKRWPEERWIGLERELAGRGWSSALAWGSEAERKSSQDLSARMRAARVLPRCGLAQFAALAARARLVVGLDTGLTHLAAAVGAPCVGIFCDYETSLVGLRGSARVASLGGVGQTPALEEVLRAAEAVLVPDGPR